MSQLLLVAPLQSEELFQIRTRNIPALSRSPRFVSRDNHNAMLAIPAQPEQLFCGAFTDEESGHAFTVEELLLYHHFGMDILLAIVTVTSADVHNLDRDQVTALEGATTRLMRSVCREVVDTDQEVRWVNRTLVMPPGKDIPLAWLQSDNPIEPILAEEGVRFLLGWGNNIAQLPPADYRMGHLKDASIISQFLWCYLSDIETTSLEILQYSNESRPSRKSPMTFDVIDLHFEMAMMSVFHERVGTEGDPETRSLVEGILDAWGFSSVVEKVDARLNRLEHILSARSEVLRRRTSSVMEIIVFTITVTTIISLVLAVVQTAFGGPVDTAPGGAIMEATRELDLDLLILASLVICVLLLIGVAWRYRTLGRSDGRRRTQFLLREMNGQHG